MTIRPTRIFPLGDSAVTVEFGNELSVELNNAAIALADHFADDPFPGLVEAVPAIASATVFYDAAAVRRHRPDAETAYLAVCDLIDGALQRLDPAQRGEGRLITVPAHFTAETGLDLEWVAKRAGLSPEEVLEIFLSSEYRVFMLGFLPGFPYLGVVDERIAAPRRSTPRTSVPKGSIGIAGGQTGIYPSESPGGWQIIGRTDLELVDVGKDPPFILAPGDRVRFVRV
jgi:inhibitor of KinA